MRTRILVLAATFLAATACTGEPPMAPTPPTTSTINVATRPTVPPPVADPIDLTPFHTHACATLTAEQQNQVGFPAPGLENTNPDTGSCYWYEKPRSYTLVFYLESDILAEEYKVSREPGSFGPRTAVFEPREIRGLPALVLAYNDRNAFCQVIVGTGDGQGISLAATINDEAGDPSLCDRLATATEMIVDGLRA